MNLCVFCGKPGVTREHIISTAVQKRMQISDGKVEIGVREETGDGEFRKAHGLNKLVVRKVCAACNNGWMSRLEVDFLAAAGPLIEPEWPRLETEFLTEAVKNGETIAPSRRIWPGSSSAASPMNSPLNCTLESCRQP
jgi:hypothetical protein